MPDRRHLTSASAASLAALLLTACGSGAAEDEDTITIVYASSIEQDGYDTGAGPVIEAFMEENPGINVEVELTPFAEYNTKLQTEMRGGAGPDVGRVNHTDIQTYHAAGFLYGLDEAIESGDLSTDELVPGLVDVGRVNGEQVTLPLTTDARVLYVNTALLAEHGYDAPPTTWEELLEITGAFAGGDAYGYGFPTENDYSLAYESAGPYINTAGGLILNEDGTEAVASLDRQTQAALQLLQNIVATGAVPPGLDNLTGDTLSQLFANNQLAMMLGGPWVRTQIESYSTDLVFGEDWVTTPVPVQNTGDLSSSAAGGWHIGAFASTEHPEAALALVEWMTRPENLEAINETEAFPPTNDGLSADPWGEDPFFEAFETVLPQARVPITPVPRLAEVAAAFESTLEPAVIDPNASLADALAAFDAQAADIIR